MIKSNIFVFGAGNNLKKHMGEILSRYNVIGFLDNNPAYRWVELIEGLNKADYEYVLVTPKDYKEIYDQLVNLGVEKEKIIIGEIDLGWKWQNSYLGMGFWGQHGEDLIINSIFQSIGIEYPTYMDVGANHPFLYSNTAIFYMGGCRGINIEANPVCMDSIRTVRKEDINLNIGIATKEGQLPFYIFQEDDGRNTFSQVEVKKSEIIGKKVSRIETIPVTTINQVLNDYCRGEFPDFLDCDIEGLDYDVLESCDMKYSSPKVICVEVRYEDVNRFDSMLKNRNYYKFCRIGENNIYVRNEFGNKVSHTAI